MANRVTGQAALAGYYSLDNGGGAMPHYFRYRIGTGGTPISGSSEFVLTAAAGNAPGCPKVPTQGVIVDAFINVLTASTGATKTLSVGLLSTSSGGAVAGILNGISVASTGLVRPAITAATSGPGTGGLFFVTNTFGSFLSTFTSGSTAAGDPGLFARRNFATDSVTAKSLSATPGSTDWVALKVDLYIGVVDITR